jgi:hypothetical protein
MVRTVVISVFLLGLVCFFIFRWQRMVDDAQPPLVTRVDIYSDRIVYRNGNYASPSTLSIALKANNSLPEIVEVRDCAAANQLAGVLDVVRAEGAKTFKIVLPEDC